MTETKRDRDCDEPKETPTANEQAVVYLPQKLKNKVRIAKVSRAQKTYERVE